MKIKKKEEEEEKKEEGLQHSKLETTELNKQKSLNSNHDPHQCFSNHNM